MFSLSATRRRRCWLRAQLGKHASSALPLPQTWTATQLSSRTPLQMWCWRGAPACSLGGGPRAGRHEHVFACCLPATRLARVCACVQQLPHETQTPPCCWAAAGRPLRPYIQPGVSVSTSKTRNNYLCVPCPAHRLSEFSGDMLGHLLRAFGDMNYYDDELLEVG